MQLERPKCKIVEIEEECLMRAAQHREILAPASLTVFAKNQMRI